MSAFERLPPHLLRKIFQHLLVAENVRQPPNHLLVEHYNFEVNILRANHAIYKEAKAVLYEENVFIKVRNHFGEAEKSMHNHEVPFFRLKGKFEYHVAEITIKIDPMNKRILASTKTNKPAISILLLADIPKFTRLLCLLDIANFIGYIFHFDLHKSPFAASTLSTMDQVELLLPFEQVRGSAFIQIVSFSKSFDPVIVKRVTTNMTQKIAWLRAGAWEIHDIALSIKRMGDKAFGLNNADMTLAKYDDTRDFLTTAMTTNSMMRGLDDVVNTAICGIVFTTWVDTALIMLSDAMLHEAGERAYKTLPNMVCHIEIAEKMAKRSNPPVSISTIARFYYLLGIAELGLDHPVKAAKAFAKSYKLVSDQSTKQGHSFAASWKDTSNDTKTARLNALLACMPKKPLSIPDMVEYCAPEVESEKWVMRELGYQGPFPYEDKIKGALAIVLTTKPHPNHHNRGPRTARVGEVKPEVLRKHVTKFRKSMNDSRAQGRLACWVGLRAHEIGEDTFLDEPGYAEAMKNMYPEQNGCNIQ